MRRTTTIARVTVTLGEQPVWYNDVLVSPSRDNAHGCLSLQLLSLFFAKKKMPEKLSHLNYFELFTKQASYEVLV